MGSKDSVSSGLFLAVFCQGQTQRRPYRVRQDSTDLTGSETVMPKSCQVNAKQQKVTTSPACEAFHQVSAVPPKAIDRINRNTLKGSLFGLGGHRIRPPTGSSGFMRPLFLMG